MLLRSGVLVVNEGSVLNMAVGSRVVSFVPTARYALGSLGVGLFCCFFARCAALRCALVRRAARAASERSLSDLRRSARGMRLRLLALPHPSAGFRALKDKTYRPRSEKAETEHTTPLISLSVLFILIR